jgi:glycosyltransferase involved in cell wall biosynthesis
MTKIAYIALQSAKKNSLGVLKKISLHSKALSEVFGEDFLGCHVAGKMEMEPRPSFLGGTPAFSFHEINAGGLFDLRHKQVRQLLSVIREKRPDIIYCRYPLACPLSLHLFRQIKKTGAKIITEHQSKELPELLMLGKKAIYLSERLFGRALLGQVDAVVGVTGEIAAYEKSRAPHLETLSIPNGFDADAVPLRKAPASSDELRLLCVASVSPWHGLDRLVQGLAEHKGTVPIRLDIVGEGSESANLKKLCQDLNMGNNVVFHGTKTGEDLDAFFDRCHLAVGSLAIHRLGLKESAILKLREYCARGIPFFYSGFDSDFGENFDFSMSVP